MGTFLISQDNFLGIISVFRGEKPETPRSKGSQLMTHSYTVNDKGWIHYYFLFLANTNQRRKVITNIIQLQIP